MGFIPLITARLSVWPGFSRIPTITVRARWTRGLPKPADEGRRAVVVGAASELVSLCEQFSRFVAVFVISLPVLWQFMWKVDAAFKTSCSALLIPADSPIPLTSRQRGQITPELIEIQRVAQGHGSRILADTRARTFTLWLRDSFFGGVCLIVVFFCARRRH